MILVSYNSSISKNLILSNSHFRHNIAAYFAWCSSTTERSSKHRHSCSWMIQCFWKKKSCEWFNDSFWLVLSLNESTLFKRIIHHNVYYLITICKKKVTLDQSRHTFKHSDWLKCVDLYHSQRWSEHKCIEKGKWEMYEHWKRCSHDTWAPDSWKCLIINPDEIMFPRPFRCFYGSENGEDTAQGHSSFSLSLWAGPDRYQCSFLLHSYPDTADPSFSLTKLIILSWRAGRQEP